MPAQRRQAVGAEAMALAGMPLLSSARPRGGGQQAARPGKRQEMRQGGRGEGRGGEGEGRGGSSQGYLAGGHTMWAVGRLCWGD